MPTTPRGRYTTSEILQSELHWGVRHKCPTNGPYIANLRGARVAIPEMLRLFEDHTRLAAILPLGLGDGEVRVAIGSEHHLEPLRDCSLVVGRYGQDSDVVGFVGVVGPTRMDYARSIGAVRYVGSLMGDLVRVMEGQ